MNNKKACVPGAAANDLVQNFGDWAKNKSSIIQAETRALNADISKNAAEINRLSAENAQLNSLLQQKLGAFMLLEEAQGI